LRQVAAARDAGDFLQGLAIENPGQARILEHALVLGGEAGPINGGKRFRAASRSASQAARCAAFRQRRAPAPVVSPARDRRRVIKAMPAACRSFGVRFNAALCGRVELPVFVLIMSLGNRMTAARGQAPPSLQACASHSADSAPTQSAVCMIMAMHLLTIPIEQGERSRSPFGNPCFDSKRRRNSTRSLLSSRRSRIDADGDRNLPRRAYIDACNYWILPQT